MSEVLYVILFGLALAVAIFFGVVVGLVAVSQAFRLIGAIHKRKPNWQLLPWESE